MFFQSLSGSLGLCIWQNKKQGMNMWVPLEYENCLRQNASILIYSYSKFVSGLKLQEEENLKSNK